VPEDESVDTHERGLYMRVPVAILLRARHPLSSGPDSPGFPAKCLRAITTTTLRGAYSTAAATVNWHMDARDRVKALGPKQRRALHLMLCRERSLPAWESFIAADSEDAPKTYVDSVVGMVHVVDPGLCRSAFEAVEAGVVSDSPVARALKERYLEPIVALQDDDLTLPRQVFLFAPRAIIEWPNI